MSDAKSSSSGSSEDAQDEVMYECKKCHERFTAAERDAHRLVHKKEKAKGRQRTGAGQDDTRSQGTLFNPIPVPPASPKRGVKRSADQGQGPSGSGKGKKTRAREGLRKSIKNYNPKVKRTRNNSG